MASNSHPGHSAELLHDKQLAIVGSPRARAPRITQRLLLQCRILSEEIRELQRERAKVRERIRQALEQGGRCEPGLRTAEIITRRVLKIR